MDLKRKAEDGALVPVPKKSKSELIAYGGSNKALAEGVSVGDNKGYYYTLPSRSYSLVKQSLKYTV